MDSPVAFDGYPLYGQDEVGNCGPMPILKFVFLAAALGGLPAALRLGPVSLGGLVTGLVFLITAILFAGKPVIPRSAIFATASLALFFVVNLVWTILTINTQHELSSDFVVWGGMLFLTLVAANSLAEKGSQLTVLERTIQLSSYIYLGVLVWLVANSAQDTATAQVGVLFFSYYLSRLYQGDKRSIAYLFAIIIAQILLTARMVVGAEIVLLVVGRMLTRGPGVRGMARMRWYAVIGSVLLAAILTAIFSSDFESKMLVGDAALNIGGLTVNTSGRMYWWKIAMESALEAPWLGHGTPGPEAMLNAARWSHPHNDYIRIFHQSGVMGCVLWLTFLWRSLVASVRGAKNRHFTNRERRWCHTTCMTLIGISIVMITDNAIVYSYVVYPCSVMIGVAIALQGRRLRSGRESDWTTDPSRMMPKPVIR